MIRHHVIFVYLNETALRGMNKTINIIRLQIEVFLLDHFIISRQHPLKKIRTAQQHLFFPFPSLLLLPFCSEALKVVIE
jgi:membrane-anchored glycerophosphoryl diester phosphodiesterase (GDPDase)